MITDQIPQCRLRYCTSFIHAHEPPSKSRRHAAPRRVVVTSVPSTMVPIARWPRRGAASFSTFQYRQTRAPCRGGSSCARRRDLVLGENPMSVEDAEAPVFPVGHDAAASLLHMRAQGVSALLQLKSTGLPVILHWGADLGDLDGLSAEALLAAFGPTGLDPLPSMMSSLVPEPSAGWSSRAARCGGLGPPAPPGPG